MNKFVVYVLLSNGEKLFGPFKAKDGRDCRERVVAYCKQAWPSSEIKHLYLTSFSHDPYLMRVTDG